MTDHAFLPLPHPCLRSFGPNYAASYHDSTTCKKNNWFSYSFPNEIGETLGTTIESYDSGELVSHSEEKESEIEYTAEELEVLKTLGYAM